MKRSKKAASWLVICMLILSILPVQVTASDWPQFLGEENAQGISEGQTAVLGSELAMRWEIGTASELVGMTWQDIPGTPIVVGKYVYFYSSQYLRKIELASGRQVASAPVYGSPVSQFFINIAYGEGKIFVPCQKDNLDDGVSMKGCYLRVFDADTLEQLYVTESVGSGQFQSPVMYHDGHIVSGTYGRNGVYAGFTTSDDDPTRPDEIKPVLWTVDPDSKYGFSFNGAAYVGDYCYFGCDNLLYVVNYKTGDARTFDIGSQYAIRSTITYSNETNRLYVASNHVDYHAAVFSYTLNADGMPDSASACKWVSKTENGGTQSSPIVYRGRLYIGGGGHTMGSYEPFTVLDAWTLQEIYTVPILSKGSAAVSTAYATEENGWQVYIYMVPYAPNADDQSELWIISDKQGQTDAKYEIVNNVGRSQYCSQSLIAASDGSLIWYNDAGRVYCYENTRGVFADTQKHWAKEHIAYLCRIDLMHSAAPEKFDTDGTVTREEFVRMLADMSGADYSSDRTNAFIDVDKNSSAVAWAVKNGIVDTLEIIFRPDEPVSRQDAVLMLYRYAVNVDKCRLENSVDKLPFVDSAKIKPQAAEAIAAIQACGVIKGIEHNGSRYFSPTRDITRAEAAAVLARYRNLLDR